MPLIKNVNMQRSKQKKKEAIYQKKKEFIFASHIFLVYSYTRGAFQLFTLFKRVVVHIEKAPAAVTTLGICKVSTQHTPLYYFNLSPTK